MESQQPTTTADHNHMKLCPSIPQVPLGKAEVKAIFGSGKRKVAGCMITQGKVQKGATVSVMRGKKVVFEGKMTSLRRVKDNVDEVRAVQNMNIPCIILGAAAGISSAPLSTPFMRFQCLWLSSKHQPFGRGTAAYPI